MPLKPFIALLALLVLLSGCAAIPKPTASLQSGQEGELGRCADFFSALDQRTRRSDALDAGLSKVAGYPYLRVDRFSASFSREVDGPRRFAAWLDRLQALDQGARRLEIANLADAADQDDLKRQVVICGDLLKAADFQTPNRRAALRQEVSVPDEYIDLRRWVGLYPLTRWGVALGVSRWQAEARDTLSLDPPPLDQERLRYLPAPGLSGPSAPEIMAGVRRDPLGIPILSSRDQQTLFQLYAPVWEVALESDADPIGSPFWDAQGRLGVDTGRPRTYTRLSLTRFRQQILIQLNYIIWFSARPKSGPLDLYGGRLDGINLRITLDSSGLPLLYETVHNCGCYYHAFPTSRLQVADQIDYAEPPLVFKAPEIDAAQTYLTLSLAAGSHHVQNIYGLTRQAGSPVLNYTLSGYDPLRSLPYRDDLRKSMFDVLGIAHGSERLERFILWPMGVLSPGAMRQ
ncbi:MAG: hypothetical protein WBG37_20245, partial [Desulfobacterales bacterium]